MRDELTDYEWAAIRPVLPTKPRGVLSCFTARLNGLRLLAVSRARRP
jgi:transposase